MAATHIEEQHIVEAMRKLPRQHWGEVLLFITSMQAKESESRGVTGRGGRRWKAAELRKLPPAERDAILADQVATAVRDYTDNPELTAFEAFGEKDFYDRGPNSPTG